MKDYVFIKGHPIATDRGLILKHRFALYEKIGPGPVNCHFCGDTIIWGTTKANDEIRVHCLDGDKTNIDPANLVPICICCLRIKTHHNPIPEGHPVYVNRNGRRSRGVERTCELCSKTFVIESANARNNPKAGRFCSGSCRSTATNREYWAKKRAQQA